MRECAYPDCDVQTKSRQGVCYLHSPRSKGSGKTPAGMCRECGKSQRDHKLGYPEHAGIQ